MHSSTQRPAQAVRSRKTQRPPLKIVLVYDGFTDLIRAHEMWSTLTGCFHGNFRVVSRAWNFALLRDPRLRRRAALSTAKADMVVLAASGRSELPDYMRTWIDAWMGWKKGRHDALVAVLDHQMRPTPTSARLCDYLRRTARATGMDFFCNAEQNQLPLQAAVGA